MTNKTPHQIIAGQSGSNCPCPRCSAGYAETLIAELEAEGWVIVPKEPTAVMLRAGSAVERIAGHMAAAYRAMLAVAPK